jgi:hypothetical protein
MEKVDVKREVGKGLVGGSQTLDVWTPVDTCLHP